MIPIPMASFMAGSLLSLLLPTLLLIGLVVWYWVFLRGAPDAARSRPEAGGAGEAPRPETPPRNTGDA